VPGTEHSHAGQHHYDSRHAADLKGPAHVSHQGHEQLFKRRLWISLILTVAALMSIGTIVVAINAQP
jgi:hypothetical protein